MKITFNINQRTIQTLRCLSAIGVVIGIATTVFFYTIEPYGQLPPETTGANEDLNDVDLVLAAHSLPAALSRNPNDMRTVIELADLKFRLKDYNGALQLYSRVLPESNLFGEVLEKKAAALSFTGRSEEALKLLKESLGSGTDSFKTYAYIAIALEKMGKRGEAANMMSQAVERAPSKKIQKQLRQFLVALQTQMVG